jgi:hypothetical protein
MLCRLDGLDCGPSNCGWIVRHDNRPDGQKTVGMTVADPSIATIRRAVT